MRRIILIISFLVASLWTVSAQVDRGEIRSGNRDFRKGNYRAAAVDYMKALDKDSTSFAGNYNLASVHYRLGDYQSAGESLGRIKDYVSGNEKEADYYFNLGDIAIVKKDWQGAVDAFRMCLLANPGDLNAKENYIYAKKHLENQQGGGQGQDQNQNQNQNQDQDQDQQDQNQNQDQDQQDQDQNQNRQDQQPASVNVSPQQAQQMLQAISAKERATQEKVEKAKAGVGVKQNDKNW